MACGRVNDRSSKATCSGCSNRMRKYYQANREEIIAKVEQYKTNNREIVLEGKRKFSEEYNQRDYVKAKAREWARNYRRGIKILVLQKVAKGGIIKCSQCRCDDVRLLEVDHVNGGGTKERLRFNSNTEYYKWILFHRNIEDLAILCRLHNQLRALESLYGKIPFIVKWESSHA